VGLGVTLGLAGTTTAAGLYTMSKHDDFLKKGCDKVDTATCRAASGQGADLQLVTNVLVTATAVVGVATIVTGVFFTKWRVHPVATPYRTGAWVGVEGTF
jgi:hypothetical protein